MGQLVSKHFFYLLQPKAHFSATTTVSVGSQLEMWIAATFLVLHTHLYLLLGSAGSANQVHGV